MLTRTSSTELRLHAGAPRVARRLVGLVLKQWGAQDDDALDAVSLVVSELVTNVLANGSLAEVVTLRLVLTEDAVEVSVADPSPVVPHPRASDERVEGGRALSLMSVLATRWGAEPAGEGRRVFAELPLVTGRCA